ncbi:hypothetical protein K450DRAFT_250787 [Umbelopsis ramanniana AG]|uniref:AD domain-containing protein n=1 Tax=Umbelopsis ramanniana AG TaxID=1314678 RepID=A0AAD5E5J8_UMBRA|nr:uncharacterized protein K450DRAFT_250787 [Umbelopsis ramanniana AG]KAI8577776.1 hypothetical protein K450DRAFT_250787 [Umbelopsis ramanniana AG]
MSIPHSADVSPLLYDMTPEEIVASRGNLVTALLSTNESQSGYLYAIDPVGGTVILKHETEDKAIVLLRHHVKSIQVNADNRLSQSQLEDLLASGVGAESLKHDSEAMRQRKQQAINLLESNRVPIKYSSDDKDILMLDSARLTPPYVPTSIQCDNSIISERISKIIQSMPPWQFQ